MVRGTSTREGPVTADADERPESPSGPWVVGIDGSSCAEHALAWAAANAAGRATDLSLVTAWQSPTVGAYPMSSPEAVVFDDRDLQAAAADEIQNLARTVQLDVPVDAVVGRGGPAEVLLAASADAALLVIGSRGRGGFARLLLGSTSTQCATHATVPTVVVPADADAVTARRLLVGFDGSPNSMAALRWAVRFAAPGSTVTVAWVWDATPLAVGSDAFFFPDASDLAAERFNHLVEPVDMEATERDVTLVRDFIRGTPRAALSERSADADLVVLGARGHGAVGSAILGSVSTWVLHHVQRPVAIVPADDDDDGASTATDPMADSET
jgi:nucleotide-binding universal stress UspA family protein